MYLAPFLFISLLKLEIISQHMVTIRLGEFVFLKVSRLRVIDKTVMFKLIIAKQIPKTTGRDFTETRQISLSLKILYGILASIGALELSKYLGVGSLEVKKRRVNVLY
jgi:hypothetical protein